MLKGVGAKTYYSDYGPYSDFQQQEVSDGELTKVDKLVKYRYYKEVKKGDYYFDVPEGYQTDPSNVLIKESDWTKELPETTKNRVIEKRDVYEYWNIKKVRYLHIHQTKGPSGKLNLLELEVLRNGQKIPYEVFCDGCSTDFEKFIQNGVSVEHQSYLEDGAHLIIDLKESYNFNELEMNLYLYDDINSQNYYWISANNSKDVNKEYVRGIQANYFVCTSPTDIKQFHYMLSNFPLKNPEYEMEFSTLEYQQPTKFQKVEKSVEYQAKDTWVYAYQMVKEFSDYMTEPSLEYPNKTNDSQTLYRFQTRDYITIPDSIIITKKNVDLRNLITSNLADIGIIHSINYQKNGDYKVTYLTPFGSFDTTATVNLEENKKIKNQPIKKEKKESRNYDIVQNSMAALVLSCCIFILILKRRKKSMEK